MKIPTVAALIVAVPLGIYVGSLMAWLLGSFFPGVSPERHGPGAFLLWRCLWAALCALIFFLIVRPLFGWLWRLL